MSSADDRNGPTSALELQECSKPQNPSEPQGAEAAQVGRSWRPRSRNEELAWAEKMRRDFTANVSHEMKTPLQVISGYAELMANGLVPPEDIPRFAQLIYDESQAMRALIDDVLVLSRLDEVAPSSEEATVVDLEPVVNHVAERLAKPARDAGVALRLQLAPVEVRGNETLLEQMIYNLVENGIRYNHPGGLVIVEVYQEAAPSVAVVRVSDTGAGIPTDKREKVFERFYRLDKSRSKETGGTGLGLAIVKHAALYHGGDVSVESQEDKGTCFTVRLPAA